MQDATSTKRQRILSLIMFVLIVTSIGFLARGAPQPTVRAAVGLIEQPAVSGRTSGRVIPTTSNPAGTGDQGVRTMANTSFEINDSGCAMTSFQYARMSDMRGWFTSHPSIAATCRGWRRRSTTG